MKKINIPLDVPKSKKKEYEKNYRLSTNKSGNMFLIAGDQKIEHLNDDFWGANISPEDASPEHLFKIAKTSKDGILATNLGLIARYGEKYNKLPYIVKINAKTNIGPNEEKNSSKPLWSVEDVVKFKKDSELNITGIGYTIYLGHKHEGELLREAAQAIFKAHQNGLIFVLWMYPRGKGIKENDIHTIAGGAGVATALGTDFVKLKYPYHLKNKKEAAEKYKEVIQAAGETKIICVGGSHRSEKDIVDFLKLQIKTGTTGIAIGRNMHQRDLKDSKVLAKKIEDVLDTKK
jgi:fructose-bisphosphate aldolase/6-deoxy-5-ketofructose 1-phosphate synthase